MAGARQRILALMQEFNIEPKKSLGQNFLISDHVIEKILNKVQSLEPDSLCEVGPGLGALTVGLMQMQRPLQVIELDRQFAQYWRDQGLDVIEVDALQWQWEKLMLPRKRILVSNLPYQISSSLVIDRTLDKSFEVMVLMFQKEVAQRLRAESKTENYGMLSVFAQCFWKMETLLEASSGDFMPAPKVASRVLVFHEMSSEVEERQQFLKFLKGCFSQPRKMMISNLQQSSHKTREALLEAFSQLNFNPKLRAQELSVKEFVALYKALGYS